MAKASKAALATTDDSNGAALALQTHDELAALGEDLSFENDGLEEINQADGDIRIAGKVFNMKGTDANGDPIPQNVYFDTVDETTTKSIDATLIALHKTNDFSYFDNDKDETVRVCSSYDRVTGTVRDTREQRPCKGCPHAEWRKDDNGKNTRDCGPVYNVAGVDRGTQMPFMVRFKKTSLKPFQAYLQKHHIGKRVVAGRRLNYPLFAFQVDMGLKMDESGKYALPVLTRGDVLSAEEIRINAEYAVAFRENMADLMARTETAGGDAEDAATAPAPGEYTEGEGQGFVEG